MEFQKLNYLNCFLIRAMFEIAQQNRVVGKKKIWLETLMEVIF